MVGRNPETGAITFSRCTLSCADDGPRFAMWAVHRLTEVASYSVTVHRSGSGSFFGGYWRGLCWMLPPKNVPDPLSLPQKSLFL